MRKPVLFYLVLLFWNFGCSSPSKLQEVEVGAGRFDQYLKLLDHKSVGLVANQTSLVDSVHLLDTLLALDVDVVKVFSPEHGFRGDADAGEVVGNDKDPKTGILVRSLYGNHKKPRAEDLQGIDIMVFDLQDVGVRFYTYISTLHNVMESCAENHIPLLVLDRPNPNAHYIDGPVLDTAYRSFVGMHPVPVVYGLSIGEYARMINGEEWLKNGIQTDLQVIPCKNYNHEKQYTLPVAPSPNLPNQKSVYLYPTLCLFEGTIVSLGRGTDFPFQVYGHPQMTGNFSFTPDSSYGAKYPKLKGEKCFGEDLRQLPVDTLFASGMMDLQYLLKAYGQLKDRKDFFIPFFDVLAGGPKLRGQIESGMSLKDIRLSWTDDLLVYKKKRIKYLLY